MEKMERQREAGEKATVSVGDEQQDDDKLLLASSPDRKGHDVGHHARSVLRDRGGE
jgi:DNA topoisomerase IA